MDEERSERPENVVEETAEGRSERTPWLALTGVSLVVSVVIAVVLAVAAVAYVLSQ